MFKLFTALVSLFLMSSVAMAATYKVDPDHSNISFTVKHLFSQVTGDFSQYEGTFNFDPAKKTAGELNFTVRTESINTKNAKRDEHLKGPDFFDVSKYPTATFTSTKVTPKGGNKFNVTGDMTMHGVTKPVTFEAAYLGADKDPWGNMRAGFKADVKLKRKDFAIEWNKKLDSGSWLLGEDVALNLQFEAIPEATTTTEETAKKAKK